MARRLDSAGAGFAAAFDALLAARRGVAENVDREAAAIVGAVREGGDAALLDYTARFDRIALTPDTIRLSEDERAAAAGAAPNSVRDALVQAAERIEAFHRRLMPADLDYRDDAGVRLGARWRPLEAVGLYVPGGTAAYPSTVLMNAVPARVAGVERIAMAVPTPDGALDPAVMAAAEVAGVTEIYRVGGAQAVAALAYGTGAIAPVDKIVGPGNAYVAAAKRLVFGTVGIDMIAGPSEILVVADAANEPEWIAADLLSQAEHDEDAQAILITDDNAFAGRVRHAVAGHLARLPRAAIAAASWREHGAVIVVGSLDEAPPLINRLAPEHLELAVAEPERLAEAVTSAGAIFLGRHTPEAIGDYVAGPNHVLPTARSARFSSGLSPLDFLKRTTFVGCGRREPRAHRPGGRDARRSRGPQCPRALGGAQARRRVGVKAWTGTRPARTGWSRSCWTRARASGGGPDYEHERRIAIHDLLEENTFAPAGGSGGPYRLRIGREEGRLLLDVENDLGVPQVRAVLPLASLRRTLRDYATICESYHEAIRTAPRSRIEAMDMGRRACHNERRRDHPPGAGRHHRYRRDDGAAAVHARPCAPCPRVGGAMGVLPGSILFACTWNSVRSPMAEGLMKKPVRHPALRGFGWRAQRRRA